jgi:hypothetical protein
MTRRLLLTFFPYHPSTMYEELDHYHLYPESEFILLRNSRKFIHKETGEKLRCKIETLDMLYNEMRNISIPIFISENLIPTGIFDVHYLDTFMQEEPLHYELPSSNPNQSDFIKQLLYNNLYTIIAIYYIKQRLLYHNMPFVELKYI